MKYKFKITVENKDKEIKIYNTVATETFPNETIQEVKEQLDIVMAEADSFAIETKDGTFWFNRNNDKLEITLQEVFGD